MNKYEQAIIIIFITSTLINITFKIYGLVITILMEGEKIKWKMK